MLNLNKKYNIIYADPPWYFKSYSKLGEGRNATRHYPCMAFNDIFNLNVPDIADVHCVLFMWVTDPFLQKSFDLIKKWNFTYKTVAFTWVKQNKKKDNFFTGLGYWTRANPEMCLLATKGKPKRISKSVNQLIISKLQEHSKKPDEIRDRIVELCGDLPRIELFARQKTPGWDVWGNEV
jgi:N6-adenosine-specific RNA methylase IME4|tara:strand:- start:465 stop:1001 length:537 start_codon:yes stop_codon:yes gene_type:complete